MAGRRSLSTKYHNARLAARLSGVDTAGSNTSTRSRTSGARASRVSTVQLAELADLDEDELALLASSDDDDDDDNNNNNNDDDDAVGGGGGAVGGYAPTHRGAPQSFLRYLQRLSVSAVAESVALDGAAVASAGAGAGTGAGAADVEGDVDGVQALYAAGPASRGAHLSPAAKVARMAEQGAAAAAAGDAAAAQELWVQAAALGLACLGRGSVPVRDIHTELALLHLDQAAYPDAIRHALAALRSNKELPPEVSAPAHPRLLLALGSAYLGARCLPKAAAALGTALRANVALVGQHHFSSYDITVRLGELHEMRGDYACARDHFRSARELLARKLDDADLLDGSLAHVSLLASLADVELKLGDLAAELADSAVSPAVTQAYTAAYTAAESALELLAAVDNDATYRVAQLEASVGDKLTDLAFLLGLHYKGLAASASTSTTTTTDAAAPDAGASHARRALAFLKLAEGRRVVKHGPGSPPVLRCLKEQAAILMVLPDHIAAASVLTELLAAETARYGRDAEPLVRTHILLGTLYLTDEPAAAALANPVKALLHFENAFAIVSAKYGLAHPKTRAVVAQAAELRSQLDAVNFMDEDELFRAAVDARARPTGAKRVVHARRRRARHRRPRKAAPRSRSSRSSRRSRSSRPKHAE